ncbi:murein transglycosylase D [Candidatus Fukatsuia symbiotica]|uniref:peptidoglycan lytic exotransglycosylase n=1 Tax=Candidatus Fukatsuia symbiotica TaxID=1878942 RepID=A0A2Y9CKA6_9GAMM|nr:murein transglycosylase D [Candidatus Fukatsuia symbiotica]AWK13271.1 murein transglycosylase D [Candidatus Fukatsuia symbiotica]MEA9444141.1 murein transglycosylase D [Candidatus Fukatsuia symbiotica]
MKTKAIFLASVLLVGCQTSKLGKQVPVQHAQSLSSANIENEAGKYTDTSRESSVRSANNSFSQKNLWGFISNELKIKVQDNALILEQRQKYLKSKSDLHDVMVRAEPYLHLIVSQIKKRNIPMELVLIPIVESAFDPRATSSANAAGLWQIVPSTGLYYGLKQNQGYDGRRDVLASTNAALDLMQNLNDTFNGDWLLTVAAYNSGEGRVRQAIKANKAQGKRLNFWALSLPRQTSVYVPKMLALSDIIKNHKEYGFNLPETSEKNGLARVDVGQQMKLTRAAEMSGLSLARLKSYNAGYKRNVTASPYYIMLPKSHAVQFRNSLAEARFTGVQSTQLAKNSTSSLKVRKRLQLANSTGGNSVTYQVRRGDSVASIAKRHGINAKDVMRWNSVVSQSNSLRPGLELTLFVNDKANPDS